MRKKNIICLVITLVIGLIEFYVFLPPINLQSMGFWSFLISLLFIYGVCSIVPSIDNKGRILKIGKGPKIAFSAIGVIIVFILLINVILSPVFQSNKYASRIDINEDSSFVDDVKEVNFNRIPLLDKDSSSKLGDRTMGQMPEMVSQYYVSELYTQINFNDNIVRVTPLEYNGLFKFFKNRNTYLYYKNNEFIK